MNKQNNNSPLNSENLGEKLALINKANEASVLMTLLCEKLGLNPQSTTHMEFVNAFSALQKQSLEYQKEIQEMYIAANPLGIKARKPRISKEQKERNEVLQNAIKEAKAYEEAVEENAD